MGRRVPRRAATARKPTIQRKSPTSNSWPSNAIPSNPAVRRRAPSSPRNTPKRNTLALLVKTREAMALGPAPKARRTPISPLLRATEYARIGEEPVGGKPEGKKTKNQCDDGKPLQGGQGLGKVAGKRAGFLGDCPPSVTLGLFSYAAKEITGIRSEIQEYVGPIRRMLTRGEEDCSRGRV